MHDIELITKIQRQLKDLTKTLVIQWLVER